MRHPCRRVIPDSLLGSPTTSTQKLRPTGFGCATGQAMWTRPAQKISSCRSCKPYRSCRGAGPTRSLPPSLPDGDQRGCPFGPLRRDLLRRNSNFSRIHAVSACVWRRINLRLCTQPSECQGAPRPSALACRLGKAAGPPVGLSCKGPSGVGRGWTTAAIDSQAFSAKAAKHSGMCCGEARKPNRKARRRFGPPAVALGLESRASSGRFLASFRLKRPGLGPFEAQ